ncbi:MAG: DUF1624 domain-containing protein [Candidatus Diapherotrites archaeon]|uniref:DUF1624 domain-containing protein n=1 Tax=Candidatus Iainarchaeum sp. TaxID=3101447 RepID=A0A938YMP3_9ARCH|nr:DUF1624 domain-containing protein [Candidatus Diapherotrites archaeon]
MKRFFEIDFLRGLAVISMIAYHTLFDLNYFAGYSFPIHSDSLFLFRSFAPVAFLLIVGLCLSISYSRARSEKGKAGLFKKYLFRGLKTFALGLAITAITWLVFPQEFIIFGVLHFIGIAIILVFPLLGKKRLSLLLGISFILLGLWLQTFHVSSHWLLWLGLVPEGFYTFDYFPLLPWLGVVLLGIFFGRALYPSAERDFRIPDLSGNRFIAFFSFLGRKSLLIYFLHQPVLVAIILFIA